MIYRKRGSTVRWENGTLVRVAESGVAVEEGEEFRCFPESPSRPSAESPGGFVRETVEAIRALVRPPLTIERLIVSHGIAEHECEGREWREETKRIHLSIVKDHLRAVLDLGDWEPRRLGDSLAALARAEATARPAPARLRLAPAVTAALLPSLVGLAPPNVRLVQTAGGVDGYGRPILEAAGEPWPNWYRPSYRVRPVRMPLNLRLECGVTEIDRDQPVAVALLAPVDGRVLRVLVVDGERVHPSTVRVTRIDAVSGERIWYPYGGGSFGAELML